MRRMLSAVAVGFLVVVLHAEAAGACSALVGRNGAVQLVRTTTLAAYHAGLEHYVTSFQFAGEGEDFGSIVPLPGVPTKVERGGNWTLQRLVREVSPVQRNAEVALADSGAGSAEVLLETRVDALDLTVLRGGGASVAEWSAAQGFKLPPDAPSVLEFYAHRSPIFLAARFDAEAARERGLSAGDGTPVHLTIPTDNPWVPLRILGVGRGPSDRIDADVFLLTDREPSLLPRPGANGLELGTDERGSEALLADLRADAGMEWMPPSMWLTHLKVHALPSELVYDLAVDVSGDHPSPVAAGLDPWMSGFVRPPSPSRPDLAVPAGIGLGVLAAAAAVTAVTASRRRGRGARPAS